MNLKQIIPIVLAILLLFSLLFQVVFGSKGLIEMNALKKEKKALRKINEELTMENLALYRKIERLKHDPEFIENIAREEFGMIGKDEIILKFKNGK
ncbi:MAG TPA: septum formation initiator family protein [Desulfobacterales bacterium]|nr:septum formation initiator family protein [Desulfobacterales bacterium]